MNQPLHSFAPKGILSLTPVHTRGRTPVAGMRFAFAGCTTLFGGSTTRQAVFARGGARREGAKPRTVGYAAHHEGEEMGECLPGRARSSSEASSSDVPELSALGTFRGDVFLGVATCFRASELRRGVAFLALTPLPLAF